MAAEHRFGLGLGETDVCANRYHEHAYASNLGRWS